MCTCARLISTQKKLPMQLLVIIGNSSYLNLNKARHIADYYCAANVHKTFFYKTIKKLENWRPPTVPATASYNGVARPEDYSILHRNVIARLRASSRWHRNGLSRIGYWHVVTWQTTGATRWKHNAPATGYVARAGGKVREFVTARKIYRIVLCRIISSE